MVKEFKDNQWALILGGSRGLGLASAKKLASHGMNICIVHRDRKSDQDEIQQHFQEIKKMGVSFISFNKDLLNQDRKMEIIHDLKEILGENGKIKCLLHSVAKGNLKPMAAEGSKALSVIDIDITIRAMATSLFDWFKLVFDHDLFAKDSRVISFTSEGSSKAMQNYGAVSAAKASLEAISRNIALEFAAFGVRSNCIQAGVTDTASLRMIPGSDKIKEHAVMRNPFGRLTLPEDVADAVYLLCKQEAAWINGCVLPVDGGENMS
ncbi:SDR family oxidoreductase [Lutimonas halocynthiae]|uniref:SDR family oxidoreductase n=1 Tax=Lutimonas halocynthiae TaxID=1446477 RepID=UPI0025B4F044|nr:SDR family oxidoreductase [Lutimonas halocynthiae]MDN3644391.1 SDR family oxidoreductase [Lutimonas halocynthiae]